MKRMTELRDFWLYRPRYGRLFTLCMAGFGASLGWVAAERHGWARWEQLIFLVAFPLALFLVDRGEGKRLAEQKEKLTAIGTSAGQAAVGSASLTDTDRIRLVLGAVMDAYELGARR